VTDCRRADLLAEPDWLWATRDDTLLATGSA
jgi:hypothetical protein